ncbi:MAG: hypothetical protein WBC44_06950, partial [Planctomycetaceae bacterium]
LDPPYGPTDQRMSTQSSDLNVYRDWLGIPDSELAEDGVPDHYALLRLVRFEDDEDKIRGNYRKLNAHVRTYASGQYGPQSQELLNELAKAMLCLTDPERKRDYDEGLGRVFEEKDVTGRMPQGHWLVRKKVISREQLREAESFAEARGLSLRDAVVQMKLVKPTMAAQAMAQELGLSYLDLPETVPDDSVLDKLPRNTVKHYSVMPLFVDDDMLLVACIDEPHHELEDELRLRYGVPTRWVIATPLAMNQAIAKYYAPGMRDSVADVEVAGKPSGGKAKKGKSAGGLAQLSAEERKQRMQVGAMIIGWGAMLPILLPFLLNMFDVVWVRSLVAWHQSIAAVVLAGAATAYTVAQEYVSVKFASIAMAIILVFALIWAVKG